MASFVLRPAGTYPKEVDLALQAKAISTSLGAAVITSLRGPEEDKFVARVEDFDALYGPPNAAWSFAHYCMRKFLKFGQGSWITRVTNSARYAGSLVFNDRDGALGSKSFFSGFKTGRFSNYKTGSQKVENYKFSTPILTGQTVHVTLNGDGDNDTPQTVNVAFEDSHDHTLAKLAAALQAALVDYTPLGKNAGQVFVNTIGVESDDDRVLTLVAPEDVLISVTAFNVTRPSSDTTSILPVITAYDNSLILEIYAQNRGAWASDKRNQGVGYRLANSDNGTKQRILLRFSQPLTTGQSLSVRFRFDDPTDNSTVDETITLAPLGQPDAPDQAGMLASLIQEFKENYPGGDGFVLDTDNNLEVVFIAPEAGANTLSIVSNFVKNPGNSNAPAPDFTIEEYLEGINATQSFDLEIYTRDDISQPKRTYTVSLLRQINENGEQLYIEDQINNNSSTASPYIRVRHNRNNLAGVINIPPEGTAIQWLSGGDDGVLPTSGDLIRTWNNYSDRRTRPARIFINCGYTALSVQQKMAALAKARYDAIAVLDFPSDKQETQAAFEYRMNAMNLNTSYASINSPDIYITDEINNKELFVPPSGHVAAIYANTDNVAASWFAPAGMNRAIIDDALGLRVEYSQNDMNLLIQGQINPIINRGGDIVLWEQFTAYRATSPFQNVSLRRMLILIEVSVVDGLDYTLHEPNDNYTGMLVVQIAVSILQPIKQGRGLYAFAAISDDRNNSNFDYDRQNRNLDLLMDPILPMRTIQLTSVITKKGASFSEVLNALQGNFSTAVT